MKSGWASTIRKGIEERSKWLKGGVRGKKESLGRRKEDRTQKKRLQEEGAIIYQSNFSLSIACDAPSLSPLVHLTS
jgi:hypothetical protein